MKRKDDDLLRLAFGELSDDAARLVEAGANAEARREIEAFRSLRQGLQHLPPPPPDGLSAERLRAAILDRELRTRPRPFAWGTVLFVPAALAALAAVVILPRLRHAAEPQIVAMREVPLDRVPKAPPLEFHGNTDAMPAFAPKAKAMPAIPARAMTEAAKPHLKRRRERRAPEPTPERHEDQLVTLNLGGSIEEETPAPKFALASREPQTIAAPPSSVVEQKPGRPGETETVVIVSNQRDLETGALAATEKEVSSVLVGG